MSRFVTLIERTYKFFASLQLAVIVIVGLAVISAVGTIYEAKYDAHYAQKIVYHSVWMYLLMGLLCINLINVMIDRLPWKRHHAAFICAHVGIILLVIGSLITRYFGVDGSVSIDIGSSNRFLLLPSTEVAIYAHLGEGDYKLLEKKGVDFLLKPPRENNYKIELGQKALKIVDYYHYALAREVVTASEEPRDGAAIRFQIENKNVNLTQWLYADWRKAGEKLELGPALVSLHHHAQGEPKFSGRNEIVFTPEGEKLRYHVFSEKRSGLLKTGYIRSGDVTDLGWMDLKLRVLKYMPHAKRYLDYDKQDYPTALSTSVMHFEFDGKKYAVGLNNNVRLFTDSAAYIVGYYNERLDLGFDVFLKDFRVGRYKGTMRAMSYESLVEIPGHGEALIYMNNPLKYRGYTLYQASFQENEMGQPVASVLSVNKDPGRWVKYLGSLLIVLGTILLFYFKRLRVKQATSNKSTS